MSTLVKRILLGLLLILGVMQFFQIDKTNPPVDPSKDFIKISKPSAQVAELLTTVCYDCHSHETKYPWYTSVAPINWWVKHHIDEGREHLNFSLWRDYNLKKRDHKLEECYEEVDEGKMPLKSYTWAHSEARLTDNQRALLATWFQQVRTEEQEFRRKKATPLKKRPKSQLE